MILLSNYVEVETISLGGGGPKYEKSLFMTTREYLSENFNTWRVRVIDKTNPQPLLHSCNNLLRRGRRGFTFLKNVTDELLQA